MAWGGSDYPVELSWGIDDDTVGDSIISSMDEAELENVCAGSLGNEFWFSIGTVTLFDVTLTNAVLRAFWDQKGETLTWSVDTYPNKPTIMEIMRLDNKAVLTMGVDAVDDVYEMNKGLNDGSIAIDGRFRTKFYDFGIPFMDKEYDRIYVKYRPQPANNTDLDVNYAVNQNVSYTALSGTKRGVIDMYDANCSIKLGEIKKIGTPREMDKRNLSIELRNSALSESFEIQGIGYSVKDAESLGIKYKTT